METVKNADRIHILMSVMGGARTKYGPLPAAVQGPYQQALTQRTDAAIDAAMQVVAEWVAEAAIAKAGELALTPKVRPGGKMDLRLRLPVWIVAQLQDAAKEAGIDAKPGAAVAMQVLEEWARNREQRLARERC